MDADHQVHYHFIGIGGIGMSALAHILLDRGYSVSGSDIAAGIPIEKLLAKGAVIHLGQDRKHVPMSGIVVYGSGISLDNVEYQEARDRALPLVHRAELLAQLMQGYQGILVSGSHGKTTVASLMTAIFQEAGLDPSYAIGGLNAQSLNGYAGKSEYFIAEADESDGSLKCYTPQAVIITNIDNEHIGNFDHKVEKLYQSFASFAGKVPCPQYCWYNGDSPLLREKKIQGRSYGFSSLCDLHIFSHCQKGWRALFSFSFQGKEYRDVEVNLTGTHNIANAAVAMGMALTFSIQEEHIRSALKQFSAPQRRLERKNRSDKFLFLEDYAHHPLEILCTLQGVREAVGLRRVVAIFQPHRFSRLQAHLEDFYRAFRDADEVIVTDVYSAGERAVEVPSLDVVAEQIARLSHVRCRYLPYHTIISYLKSHVRVHDVCVSLGAGNIHMIGEAMRDFDPARLSLGVICGGQSYEHDISVLSAQNIVRYLSPDYYDVHYFMINQEGLWAKVDSFDSDTEKEYFEVLSPEIASHIRSMHFILPILHGSLGEDGTLQGFLEILGKPYGGPSLLFSAICMDKLITKRLVASVGVPVVPYYPLTLQNWKREPELCIHRILERFSFPMFVKTTHLGSSIGVFEVYTEEELRESITEAFVYDTDVFIEESCIGAREIELSCIGDAFSYYVMTAPHERCGFQKFIDYETKYGLNGKPSAAIEYNVDLREEEKNTLRELAERAYRVLKGMGSCRIDFFLDKERKFWLSEINTIPGMTAGSPFLQDFVQMGWSCQQVVHELVISGLYRWDRRRINKNIGKTGLVEVIN